ncbi:MAG: ShlB/FhaC/HecB family hemolysin secretion/activation protein [Gammaproteobacteria bacterium]|nr:ShlB/FhaC/HecB family hemolysin secretion/activation protein [Gammaproteobacteria bacterium]
MYSAPELFEIYGPHLGLPIDRSSVSAIVTALADRYQRDGYPRPRISVDSALVEAGIVRMDVAETRIASIAIGGDPGPHRDELERLGRQLTAQRPLMRHDLQNVLRRMRALPGLELTAATESVEDLPNAYRLDVDAEFRPVGASLRLTNRGTDEIGPHFLLGQLLADGMAGGSLSAGILFAAATDYEEYRGAGPLLAWNVGREGARIVLSGLRSRARPDRSGLDLDDLFVRDRLGLTGSLPLYTGARMTASLSAELEATGLEISRADFSFRDEQLRMLSVGMDQIWRGDAVQYAGSAEIVKGLGALGSGLTALDLETDPRSAEFTLLRLDLVRLARIAPRWTMRFDGFAQHSSYALPFTERFKIGGERLGRGFERAALAGDSGIGAKLELARDLPAAPRWLGRASIYGFYDVGAVWKQDVPGRDSAATAGLGLALRDDGTIARLELAQPLIAPDVEGRDDLRVFFELSWRR